MIEILNAETFPERVLRYSGSVVVIWGADYAGPFKKFIPVVEGAMAACECKVRVALVSVDECQALGVAYEVRGLPSLFVFQGGQVAAKYLGSRTHRELVALFERLNPET